MRINLLDALEDSLKLATIDENWKNRVGRQSELRARFNAPDLTIRYQGPFQIIDIDGREITLGSMATDDQIAAEINKIRQTETPKMSITGLQSGAFKAQMEAMRQRLIDKQTAGGAKIVAAGEAAAVKIDEAVLNAEQKIDKEVSEVLQDFSEFTNGGPA